MLKRLKRHRAFELSLAIHDDGFIAPPREGQRHWLVNKAMSEFADDLVALDHAASRFVPGQEAVHVADRQQAVLADADIMEDWQVPVMRAMAEIVAAAHGDVLEVGFGRGVSAGLIQEIGVRSHTIVECNDSIVARYRSWRASHPDRDIRLLHGRWQDVTGDLETYDGVFFHTFPLSEDEYVEQVVRSVTFARHFFPTAAACLRPGGVFTYLTNEFDSLSRGHQRLLFAHFRSFTLERLAPLAVPADTRDTLWADAMVVIRAVK